MTLQLQQQWRHDGETEPHPTTPPAPVKRKTSKPATKH
jgi:hypothetical protein